MVEWLIGAAFAAIGMVIAWLVYYQVRMIERLDKERQERQDWDAWQEEVDHDGAA